MNLADFASITIYKINTFKFVVCELSDELGNKRLVVRADPHADWHKEIVARFKREAVNFTVKCVGGGKVRFDYDTKTINLFDHSGDYGREPDRTQTSALFQF